MRLDAHVVVGTGNGFSLDARIVVEEGHTVALLGPNGAGKTTALSAIAGIVPLSAGHIRLGETILDDPASGVFVAPEDRKIGVVFQNHVLFPHMSVLDNVAFPLRSAGSARGDARTAAAGWLQQVGLGELAVRRPHELSGGQSQLVALARTLASDPAALLLDEPLAALDVTVRTSLRRTLAAHLEDFAGPRLLVTHDPVEAFLFADHVVVLEDGSVAQAGTPDELRRHPATPYVADLVGVNLVRGIAADGEVLVDDAPPIQIADSAISGPVLLSIHPRSISVHTARPVGSPRNAWQTTLAALEPIGERIRLQLGDPHPFTVEVTEAARDALDLRTGLRVWVALKATEIGVKPG